MKVAIGGIRLTPLNLFPNFINYSIQPSAPVIPELSEMPVWRSSTPTAPKAEVEDDDLPPSYKELFPHTGTIIR